MLGCYVRDAGDIDVVPFAETARDMARRLCGTPAAHNEADTPRGAATRLTAILGPFLHEMLKYARLFVAARNTFTGDCGRTIYVPFLEVRRPEALFLIQVSQGALNAMEIWIFDVDGRFPPFGTARAFARVHNVTAQDGRGALL